MVEKHHLVPSRTKEVRERHCAPTVARSTHQRVRGIESPGFFRFELTKGPARGCVCTASPVALDNSLVRSIPCPHMHHTPTYGTPMRFAHAPWKRWHSHTHKTHRALSGCHRFRGACINRFGARVVLSLHAPHTVRERSHARKRFARAPWKRWHPHTHKTHRAPSGCHRFRGACISCVCCVPNKPPNKPSPHLPPTHIYPNRTMPPYYSTTHGTPF